MAKRTLYLKATNNEQLQQMWKTQVALKGVLYIRCNKRGEVNWDKSIVYDSIELAGRDNVIILP